MEELLLAESHAYLYLDNPEILLKDSQLHCRGGSLNKKVNKTCTRIKKMIASGFSPDEIIDQSVELITAELRPSRFGYVCAVIASEFPNTFIRWVKTNALTDQVLEVLSACEPVFSLLKFNVRTAEQHSIYTTVTNFIRHYLKNKRVESLLQPLRAKINNPAASGLEIPVKARTAQTLPAARSEELPKAAAVPNSQAVIKAAQAALPELILRPARLVSAQAPARIVHYFKSELLEKSADFRCQEPAATGISTAVTEPSEKTQNMASKQYPINKGINKSLVFKGLKAQYIGYMGLGLLIDLLFYAVLYIFKINTYITLLLTVALGALITVVVYHLNTAYGEHGLSKSLAKRRTPKIIRSFSRRLFR